MSNKFEIGELVETSAVNEKRKSDRYFDLFCRVSFARYEYGDWGDMCEEDKQTNDEALKNGERLMGVYIFDMDDMLNYIGSMTMMSTVDNEITWYPKKTEDKDPNGLKIYIITEWDRSVTTILFPSDY